MVKVSGRGGVDRVFAQAPQTIIDKLLPGAARAAATVVADEAKLRSVSTEVTAAIKVSVSRKDDQVVGRVLVKGKGDYIAPWLEYGTTAHFISVDMRQSGGRSAGRVNRLVEAGVGEVAASLVIGGKFVGDTVYHPGARPHPFLRVSLDIKRGEAIAAAQSYIAARTAGGRGRRSQRGDEVRI